MNLPKTSFDPMLVGDLNSQLLSTLGHWSPLDSPHADLVLYMHHHAGV